MKTKQEQWKEVDKDIKDFVKELAKTFGQPKSVKVEKDGKIIFKQGDMI